MRRESLTPDPSPRGEGSDMLCNEGGRYGTAEGILVMSRRIISSEGISGGNYGFNSLNIAISLSKRLTISSNCGLLRCMMSAMYSFIGLLSGPMLPLP